MPFGFIPFMKLFFSYSACVRRAAGYCCVEYNVCQGVPSAFSLDAGHAIILGATDSLCTSDYIGIPGITRTLLE